MKWTQYSRSVLILTFGCLTTLLQVINVVVNKTNRPHRPGVCGGGGGGGDGGGDDMVMMLEVVVLVWC